LRKLIMAALIATTPVHVAAQDQGPAILYSKGDFAGPSITLTGPTTKMTPFNLKSLRIPSGSVWELCSGNTFTGCESFSESRPGMVRTVRSARPVAAPIADNVTFPVGASGIEAGASLRGLESEFFVVPAEGRSRVEVPVGSGAKSRAASAFCRTRGWRLSAYERVQSASGRMFLADVLCVNQDN
jgi:hypothetical protein